MVGRAVGINTVSKATRKMLSVKATKHSKVGIPVLDEDGSSLPVGIVEEVNGGVDRPPHRWCLRPPVEDGVRTPSMLLEIVEAAERCLGRAYSD
jgi:hypothetical protein